MNQTIDYDAYATANRTRFHRMMLRMGLPGRRQRSRDPEEWAVLLRLMLARKRRWEEEGRLVEVGPRQYIFR